MYPEWYRFITLIRQSAQPHSAHAGRIAAVWMTPECPHGAYCSLCPSERTVSGTEVASTGSRANAGASHYRVRLLKSACNVLDSMLAKCYAKSLTKAIS